MKTIRHLALAAVLLVGVAAANAAPQKPDFLFPSYEGGSVIHGLSNNGLFGVASATAREDGNTHETGAIIYDLRGERPVATLLSSGHAYAGANDVTDDGLTVVGVMDFQPTVWRNVDGKWVAETLPVPDSSFQQKLTNPQSGAVTYVTYKIDGAIIAAVTPDGKYAVGKGTCQDNIMFEEAVMWDLEKKEIIPLPECSLLNVFGNDDHLSRFMQVSDDGRYILGWNSFPYPGDDYVYVYDRVEKKQIAPFYKISKSGNFTYRLPGYDFMELDGISKSLTSTGQYVTGRVEKGNSSYAFLFDVFSETLTILDDYVHDDVWGWSVTKDGLVLGGTPAVTPYADALAYYNNYMYPLASLYEDVYGFNLNNVGLDNTGKPTLVSEDAQTIVFVTGQNTSYVVRLHEPLTDALDRINLMSGWTVFPAENTKMTRISDITITFNNMVEGDPTKYAEVALVDSDGKTVAKARENGVSVNNLKLYVSFPETKLEADKKYTVVIPAGLCHIKGQTTSVNEEIRVDYVGRADVPVAVSVISPAEHSSLSSLDLNDNPVVVKFDTDVKINGTADNRPIAHLYVDGASEPAASLNLDVDQYTNSLVIYPTSTYYLYKGAEYTISVPQGAVTDLSGAGASEAFNISYHGSYVPQLGDEIYLFKSTCDDFANFLFFEGDHGQPTSEYVNMGFTAENTPWWVVMDEEIEDMAFASHSSYTDGRKANDWVATLQLKLPDDVDTYITFQSQSYRFSKQDYLKVYIYENEAVLTQLTQQTIDDIIANGDLVYNELQSPGKTEDKLAGEWTDNVISLEDYKGKAIYICFVNDNQNQSMVMIDNLFVMKNVNSFISITGNTNVVNMPSVAIKGIVTVQSDLAEYSSISMTLLDGEGNEVSKIEESGLSLSAGDIYNFEFPRELPLVVGEENPYTIRYSLDDDASTYTGLVRNLAFQPEKRVVVEEYTGRDCQFCPLGIAMMERLESLYGSKVIPVVLHAYNGSDPKGANILSYAASVFAGSTAAPNGRINRRPNLSAPMYSDQSGKYHNTAADVPGADNTWLDDVVEELGEPAYLEVSAFNSVEEPTKYDVTVKTAVNLTEQNIRVLGVLLEDGLIDFQANGVFNLTDPLLGEFGNGGAYGRSQFFYMFNNVARGVWGQSANGTGGLIPSTLKVGEEYKVAIEYPVPGIVEKPENTKMVVMLLNENTGRVINATVSTSDPSGVGEIADEAAASINISKSGQVVVVEGADAIEAAVYTLDGRMLKAANGNGRVEIGLDGYKGIVIVRASAGGSAVVRKLAF